MLFLPPVQVAMTRVRVVPCCVSRVVCPVPRVPCSIFSVPLSVFLFCLPFVLLPSLPFFLSLPARIFSLLASSCLFPLTCFLLLAYSCLLPFACLLACWLLLACYHFEASIANLEKQNSVWGLALESFEREECFAPSPALERGAPSLILKATT